MKDFIIDILLGCPHPDIRLSVVNQLYQLCQAIDTGETLSVQCHGSVDCNIVVYICHYSLLFTAFVFMYMYHTCRYIAVYTVQNY